MSYQKCPVCEGRGNVPQGFYARQSPLATTVPLTEPCRSCEGKGVLLSPAPLMPFTRIGPDPHKPAFQPLTKPPETGDPIPPYPVTTCGAGAS